jgi:hypothetical protein
MLAEIIPKIAGQFDNHESKYYSRPSLAGPDRCTRQMVYWGLNVPRAPLPGRSLLVFDDGHWHEELTADWIRKSAYHLHSEQMEINIGFPGYEFKLTGHIDGVITDLMNVDFLWEHKSINHFTWNMFLNGKIPADYVTQCCIYLRGLHELNNGITSAVLLMKNKNTAQYLEFIIEYDYETDCAIVLSVADSNGKLKELNASIPNIVGDAFAKFRTINKCISTATLPKRDYFIDDDWQCEYCGWCRECWKNYHQEFAELKTDVMLPDDVADMLRYYKELGASKSEMEKEYKELAGKIKETMKEIGSREGRAGEYIVRLKLIESSRIDKELLTEEEIARASVPSLSERLYISKPKKEEVKK